MPRMDIRQRATRWLPWLGIPVGAAYLIVLATQIGAVLRSLSWNADNANMLNLANELSSLPAGEVIHMGNAPLYTTVWFNWIAGQVFGVGDWLQSLPLVWYAIGAALVVWSVWRAASRWAGSITGVLLVCLNPLTLEIASSFATHGPAWFSAALLGAAAVYFVTPGRGRRWRVKLPVALAIGLLTGANLASDPLVLSVAVLPFVCLVGVLWLWSQDRVSPMLPEGFALLGTTGVGFAAARAVGSATGITADTPAPQFATVEQIWANVLSIISNVARFVGPAPLGEDLDWGAPLRLVAGVAGLVCIALGVRIGWRALVRFKQERHIVPAERAGFALIAYWTFNVAISVALFATSPLAFGVGSSSSSRYSLNLFIALAVMIPLVFANHGTRGRIAGGVLAALVAFVGIQGLLDTRETRAATETTAMAIHGPAAMKFAADAGAIKGYAGYWNASALTWDTGVRVVPVVNCPSPRGDTLCASKFAVPGHLLRASRDQKTFVLIDPAYPGAPAEAYLGLFGRWESLRTFGGLTLIVYPYDVAKHFGST